jgi:hypothetical protein
VQEVQDVSARLLPHDIAEVRTEQGKLYLFVAIDRTSKFAFVEVHEKATQRVAADFLNARSNHPKTPVRGFTWCC